MPYRAHFHPLSSWHHLVSGFLPWRYSVASLFSSKTFFAPLPAANINCSPLGGHFDFTPCIIPPGHSFIFQLALTCIIHTLASFYNHSRQLVWLWQYPHVSLNNIFFWDLMFHKYRRSKQMPPFCWFCWLLRQRGNLCQMTFKVQSVSV